MDAKEIYWDEIPVIYIEEAKVVKSNSTTKYRLDAIDLLMIVTA